MVGGDQASSLSLVTAAVVGCFAKVRGMVGESAVKAFRVTRTASCDDSGDDVSWFGPFDHLWFAPGCPIGSVKPFCDSDRTEPFLNLSANGDNLALLSEVVIPFFGDMFL